MVRAGTSGMIVGDEWDWSERMQREGRGCEGRSRPGRGRAKSG